MFFSFSVGIKFLGCKIEKFSIKIRKDEEHLFKAQNTKHFIKLLISYSNFSQKLLFLNYYLTLLSNKNFLKMPQRKIKGKMNFIEGMSTQA